MFDLYEFQKTASDNLLSAVCKLQQQATNTTRSVLLQSATGSGKTVIATDFIFNFLATNKNHKVLILLNRQILIGQTFDTLKVFNTKC